MTLDTRALLGLVILLLALLALRRELVPTLKPLGAAAWWCLRKLCWLWVVVAWGAALMVMIVIAAVLIVVMESVALISGMAQDRRIALVARRKGS